MKSKRNYSFKKASSAISDIIAKILTDMARYQNESIQRGIDTQTDINGKKYDKLKESTLTIRNRRGHGFTPLSTMKKGAIGSSGRDFSSSKSLRATKMIPAEREKLVSAVLMLNKHGTYHNQDGGFISGGMIKGKPVPQREWFGISKEMEKGGQQYNKFIRMTLTKIKKSLII